MMQHEMQHEISALAPYFGHEKTTSLLPAWWFLIIIINTIEYLFGFST